MNVQDVIERALAGNDGIPVTPVEHSSCQDVQVEKLASALNFIGTNLESSFADLEKEAAIQAHFPLSGPVSPTVSPSFLQQHGKKLKYAGGALALGGATAYGVKKYRDRKKAESKSKDEEKRASILSSPVVVVGGALGAAGAHQARNEMRRAGMSEQDIDESRSHLGGAARGMGRYLGYGVGGTLGGAAAGGLLGSVGGTNGATAGALIGGGLGSITGLGYGAYRSYKGEVDAGREAIRAHKQRGQQKTASVDDVLYQAAQAGKQALLEKVAEDRINPAKISAGPAASYSGEIMPSGPAVFGGGTMPAQLIAMKAQKVRARINSDMKQFVNNVGDGYNLQGHLNKMNK